MKVNERRCGCLRGDDRHNPIPNSPTTKRHPRKHTAVCKSCSANAYWDGWDHGKLLPALRKKHFNLPSGYSVNSSEFLQRRCMIIGNNQTRIDCLVPLLTLFQPLKVSVVSQFPLVLVTTSFFSIKAHLYGSGHILDHMSSIDTTHDNSWTVILQFSLLCEIYKQWVWRWIR